MDRAELILMPEFRAIFEIKRIDTPFASSDVHAHTARYGLNIARQAEFIWTDAARLIRAIPCPFPAPGRWYFLRHEAGVPGIRRVLSPFFGRGVGLSATGIGNWPKQ